MKKIPFIKRVSKLRETLTKAKARSLFIKTKSWIFIELSKQRDLFFFSPTLNLLEFLLEKNNRQIRSYRIFAVEYILGYCENLHKIYTYLERVHQEICKVYKSTQNPAKNLEALSLNLKVEMKQNLRFIDVMPEDFEENPLLSSGNSKKFLNLFFDDEYGFTEIRLPNNDAEHPITMIKILILLIEVVVSKWEWICYILLIGYHFYSQAICSFFIIFYTFAFLCVEEHHTLARTWKPLFLYIFLVALIKMIMFLPMVKPFSDQDMQNNKAFIYSNDYIPIYKVKFFEYETIKNLFSLFSVLIFQFPMSFGCFSSLGSRSKN